MVVTMLAHYILRCSTLFCNCLHFQEHVDGLVQDCGNSTSLAMELLQSVTANLYSLLEMIRTQTVGDNACRCMLHVLLALCTSLGSHVHTISQMICSSGISNKNGWITATTCISATFKLLQVPFWFSRYHHHSAGTVLWITFWRAGTFSSNSHNRSL